MSYSIMNDPTIYLHEPGSEQKKVLDKFRLTEVFRDAYGNHLLNNFPQGQAVQSAINAVKKFKRVDNVNIEEYRDLIIDLIYAKYVLNFYYREYFLFEFENKSIDQRLDFLASQNCHIYRKLFIQNQEDVHKLDDKYLTYQLLKPYYKRDMCCIKSMEQKTEFIDFCQKHKQFLVKPVGSFEGRGVEIVNCEGKKPEELLSELLESVGAFAPIKKYDEQPKLLCEELIVNDDSIKAIHPTSVNSVRIYTYINTHDEPTLVMSFIKAGQHGAIIDNVGPGGMLAAVDVNTGVIFTDAADEVGNMFSAHPDTGFVFKGFQIPRWEELKKMVLEIAPIFPGVKMIGWDVALSKDRGWQIIEGNVRGDYSVNQIVTKTGLRKELEAAFEWDMLRQKPKKTT